MTNSQSEKVLADIAYGYLKQLHHLKRKRDRFNDRVADFLLMCTEVIFFVHITLYFKRIRYLFKTSNILSKENY